MNNQTTLLIVLDGFGFSDTKKHNAIAQANTPFIDQLYAKQPNALIQTSGEAVGLPKGQMGNSEVGHMTMGAGRTLQQDLVKINNSIKSDAFLNNHELQATLSKCQKNQCNLHIMGLLSDGGVHSHIDHLLATVEAAKTFKIPNIHIHAFLDGRDTPPQSGVVYIKQLQEAIKDRKNIYISSIIGRYYAMDRDQKHARTKKAFDLLRCGNFQQCFSDPLEAIKHLYTQKITDEFVPPVVTSCHFSFIKNEDHVIFTNFRSDRARQIVEALTQDNDFNNQENLTPLAESHFLCFKHYKKSFKTPVIFKHCVPKNTLGEIISHANLSQLRLSETEKYAHITFFFNGGLETPFPKEERKLIASPNVKTYDAAPKMSAEAVTEFCLQAIESKQYNFILVNFANADMVGHTGNFSACKTAIECLDDCLMQIAQHHQNINLIITADHGNAEKMFDEKTKMPHTAHTNYDVPIFYVGQLDIRLKSGSLQDIAPTVLELMNLPIPKEMGGSSLIVKP